MQKFDVLIVGGGMVGLTLALAIRKQTSLTVAVVDNNTPTATNEELEVRVSAINAVSQQLFANLNVWKNIETQRLQPYQHMHIWDKAGYGKLDFSLEDLYGESQNNMSTEQLGWIIENNVIRNVLWEQAIADQGITFFTEEKITNVALGDSEAFISFGNQAPVTAKLVVGADGANSWLRQQMNFSMTFRDYDHHAIVATVKCEQGHSNTAWQVFLPTGPLAFLPLQTPSVSPPTTAEKDNAKQAQYCSIVWSTSPEEAKRLSALPADDFSKELTAASDGKLGKIALVSERSTYPLTMRFCQEFVKDRVVLVGDAAHTIHPLAGQGVNLGLLDAAALAQILTDQVNKNSQLHSDDNWFNSTSLNAFARWRKNDASEMIVAMEAIKQLFTPQQAIPKVIRGLSMSLMNKIKPAKKVMIKQALGYKGELPTLAKKPIL